MAMASFGSGSVLLGDFLVYYFKGIKKDRKEGEVSRPLLVKA